MIRPSHVGYLTIAVGIMIGLLSFRFGGGTQRACPGIDSFVYDLISVQPSRMGITNIEFATATIEWYDGCNWHTQSLVPVVLGLFVSLAGVGTVRAYGSTDSEADTHRVDTD